MNLEEFGPDAKDEMSPADYIKFLMDKYYEYRTLAADPTINDQAFKLYLDKASEYYTRAQEAMDEIEPDNTDHLSDEDKALPNISLADQENELNNDNNTNEMFTKQARQYDQWADDNDKLKAKKAAELSDKDKAMIDKYEDEEKEQEDSETNKIDAKMYREDIDVERWGKLAGINENEELGNDKWSSEDGKEIKWINPINPNETLYDVEADETITKGEYYNDNVLGRDSDETQPNYGTKTNGKWNFSWDSGEIEGFVEGEDFEFV